jgi:hypothetical protein
VARIGAQESGEEKQNIKYNNSVRASKARKKEDKKRCE